MNLVISDSTFERTIFVEKPELTRMVMMTSTKTVKASLAKMSEPRIFLSAGRKFFATEIEQEYQSTETVVITTMSFDITVNAFVASIPVESVDAGIDTIAAESQINQIRDPIPGIDGVVNVDVVGGGRDRESDQRYADRLLDILSANNIGTKSGYAAETIELENVNGVSIVGANDPFMFRDLTRNFIDQLEQSLGAESQPTLQSLSTSLDNLATRLEFVLADTVKKKESLEMNTEFAIESDVRVVDPGLPDMEQIQAQLNQSLPVGSSPEINELHQSSAQANIVRDPSALRNFRRRKSSQVRANLQEKIAATGRALANVNAFRAEIAGKIN